MNTNKSGRPKLPYNYLPVNIRIDVRLIDLMNDECINKTSLINKLISDHYKKQEIIK